jgi:hypothetical protein
MFLFVIFLFFALFHALGAEDKWVEGIRTSSTVETEQALRASDDELANLRRRLAREDDADDRVELGKKIKHIEGRRKALQAVVASGGPGLDISDGKVTATGAGRSVWDNARQDPKLLIYKLQTNAYKFAWLLIPISVPFVALTFLWRRRFGLYDHTVFTTYSITFMFALVGLATLASYFISGKVGLLVLLYAPAHLYWQLRGTYALGRLSAFWRMLVLSAFAWIAIIVFLGLMTAMAEG